MKYIGFWEFAPEDIDKVLSLFQKMEELRAKGSKDYPRAIFPTHVFANETSGFTIYEVDNPQQLINHHVFYLTVPHTMRPITDATEVMAAYMKSKK